MLLRLDTMTGEELGQQFSEVVVSPVIGSFQMCIHEFHFTQ